MKTALILGVSGQDGAYLAEFLLEKGYNVYGTSRDAELARFGNLRALGIRDRVTCHSASPTDFRSIFQVIRQVEPDEIYNLAGQTSVGLSFAQPVETMESISLGTLNVLEAVRMLDKPIRLYNAGSGECFGNTAGNPATELTAFTPRSPYAVAKAAAVWTVSNYREAYHLFACSGILFNHESPLRPDRFVTRKIVKGAAEIALGRRERLQVGNLGVRRDWGWAPEYVDAMWRMLQADTAEDFVIATGKDHALEDFARLAFEAFDLDWRDYVDVSPTLFRPTDIEVGVGDAGKAERLLGWRAELDLAEIVRRMAEAERDKLLAEES
ncbi:MAG: GDP-mannose 4,6-dehydratase [Rhodospirillaceae bacterium]|nr:GDP-mannose 4,6-dehydratase [Rhodospirillaceae bacterium]|tara:strand:- start:1629 stop:2603 length:975 start_codon:yes stop_codon:yes gene_type:complete